MWLINSRSGSKNNSSTTLCANTDQRLTAPALALATVRANIATPGGAPKNGQARLATPCAISSRLNFTSPRSSRNRSETTTVSNWLIVINPARVKAG